MKIHSLQLPLNLEDIKQLGINDKVLLTGELLTARDAAHKRIAELILRGDKLPLNLSTTSLFYCGPSPKPVGRVCGAIGPTTSSRMDTWTPLLLENGLKLMIGKGERSEATRKAIIENGAAYLVCVGGAAAYLARHIVSCETFLWSELGPEAVYKLIVKDFAAYVAIA